MMDWTDRNCRAFHRALSSRALLYTEMVTAPAVIHGDRERLLGFDAVEHPVALQLGGSDPAQLKTEAVFDGTDYVINGLKWLITGANGAKTWIIMARVAPNAHGPDGPTLFLCEGDTPGIVIERVMNSMDRNYVEGHGVVRFDNLTLPASAVLGEVGEAFRYAQMRLAPARMTHCMRWIGAAARAHSIAIDHARKRTAFGKPLGEHQGVSFLLAQNEIDLKVSRLLTWQTAWLMDQGVKGRHESSIAKSEISERLFQVTDRCVQVLGGIGVTDETVVEMIYRDMRPFRLYDGPTEVHKFAIGRQLMRSGSEFATTPTADGLPVPYAKAAELATRAGGPSGKASSSRPMSPPGARAASGNM